MNGRPVLWKRTALLTELLLRGNGRSRTYNLMTPAFTPAATPQVNLDSNSATTPTGIGVVLLLFPDFDYALHFHLLDAIVYFEEHQFYYKGRDPLRASDGNRTRIIGLADRCSNR